jgi:hypothetical protein
LNSQIELERNNVTVAEFFNYIKSQCAKKDMAFGLERDREEFENPSVTHDYSYYVKDGIKYVHMSDGPDQQWDASDAAAQSEIYRVKPLSYHNYGLYHDGSCYNEICEFTYDDDKRGHGYYFQLNKDALELEQGQQNGEIADGITASEKIGAEILEKIEEGKLIDSFEKVWEEIGGENKPYAEVLETLDEEISQREHLGSELHKSQDFTTLTKVERESDAFVQARYGLQGLAYLGEPERLKEIGLDESPIWKDAHAKGAEIRNREAELFQASKDRAEAQKGQELVSEAAALPRGLDSNLEGADLSGVQETVLAASDKARSQVNDLRASATSRESAASAATDKITEARNIAKKQLGGGAIVTSDIPGRAYSGKIIGIIGDGPDKTAVQAISDNRAILHTIKDISAQSNVKLGEDVSLTADEQGYSASQSIGSAASDKKHTLAREGMKR